MNSSSSCKALEKINKERTQRSERQRKR